MKYLGYYKTPPKEGENVVQIHPAWDFSLMALFQAWRECCKIAQKDLLIDQIIIHDWPVHVSSLGFYDLLRGLDSVAGIGVLYDEDDPDEWWVIFKDSNIIFYSAGA